MADEILIKQTKTIQARESTYGTDEIDLANNLAVARRYEAYTQVTVTPNGDFRERNITRPGFSNNRGQYKARNLSFAIEGIVPAPATAGNAPLGMADLMVATGMSEAVAPDTTATYTLETTAQAGLTIYHWLRQADAYTWRFVYGTGCRGNMSISGSIRNFLTFQSGLESNNFPIGSGLNSDPHGWSLDLAWFDSDGTILLDKNGVGISYAGAETMDDPRGLMLEPDSVITIDSVAFPISAFSLDWGVTPKVKEATSASAYGTAGTWVTGRNVNGNFTLEDGGAAFEKALDLLHADSEVSCTIVLTDGLGSGGTTLTITMGDLQLRSVDGPNDNEGLAAWTLPFQANADWSNELGDNELTLVWSVTA